MLSFCIKIPLYTTSKTFPWHTTRTPLSISLSSNEGNAYRYRYAIYRGSAFHRWETPSDGGSTPATAGGADTEGVHSIPLNSFRAGELYTVNDTLGLTSPDSTEIDHIKLRNTFSSVGSLARRNSSTSAASLYALNNKSRNNSSAALAGEGKKKVGFAPAPVSPASRVENKRRQAVHLTSSDGLIVVSAFLPVHLTRSDSGEWTADWDYEALLSMQTHLRVTRVGTVKWRGWHGNVGGGKSDESGVPLEERGKVEAVLRPFNCVPVWVPTTVFGEM